MAWRLQYLRTGYALPSDQPKRTSVPCPTALRGAHEDLPDRPDPPLTRRDRPLQRAAWPRAGEPSRDRRDLLLAPVPYPALPWADAARPEFQTAAADLRGAPRLAQPPELGQGRPPNRRTFAGSDRRALVESVLRAVHRDDPAPGQETIARRRHLHLPQHPAP